METIKKFGIVTSHWSDNCGALLQCYALQKTMQKKNLSVFVVEFIKKKPLFLKIKTFAKNVLLFQSAFKMHRLCKKFRTKHLNVIKIADEKPDIDCFVFGSDQIWNFALSSPIYLGDFPKKENAVLVSYAASIGRDSIDEQYKAMFKDKLSSFSLISVREEKAKEALSELTDKPLEVLLDPTLLIEREEWQQFIKNNHHKRKPYIVVYNMNKYPITMDVANKIAKDKDLDIIEIAPTKKSIRKKSHKIFDSAGPMEFLELIRDAEYVVTNSFHGTAFSINFHKNFYTTPHKRTNSRILNILGIVGLNRRLITSVDEINYDDVIDYNNVEEKLNLERKKANGFINKIIEIAK